MEFYARKAGHVLSIRLICLLFFLNYTKLKSSNRYFCSWLLKTIVGFGDELNQYFIAGQG
ncbi:hypothetical protein DS745_07155 [Anaerobacillus alkaliphilus]|uniref:Uncharacterized protein n=1 Tax=Anaerobacillus alkaliphilus TaxID=1548597 RepID=A0A4Q0VV17_9BACI|nr:hypothetical protein DS745_07155 [Anaerobacillus alkaliphilus]